MYHTMFLPQHNLYALVRVRMNKCWRGSKALVQMGLDTRLVVQMGLLELLMSWTESCFWRDRFAPAAGHALTVRSREHSS